MNLSSMVLESTEKAPRPGLSLYANLLDAKASAPGTISRAPVVFKQHGGGTDRHEDDVSASGQQTSLGTHAPPRGPLVGTFAV